MHKSIIIKLLILISTMFLTCNDNPLSWEDLLVPGRRDYVWTVDTLENIAPNNSYYHIWGTDPKSVWCVGNIGDLDKNLLHFDGESWTPYKNIPVNPAIEAWSIFGFSSNDFWIGSGEGIWRFNGNTFEKYPREMQEGFDRRYFMNIWGDDPNNLLSVGCSVINPDKYYADIMKFEGGKWNYLLKPGKEEQFVDIKRGLKTSTSYFIKSKKIGLYDTTKIYEYTNSTLKLIISDHWDYKPTMFVLAQRLYFYFYKKLQTYSDGNFIIYKDFSSDNIIPGRVFGKSEKDFFLPTVNGIGHYNGTNVETIYTINEPFEFEDAVVLEKEVFFLIIHRTNWEFYILHGKLK